MWPQPFEISCIEFSMAQQHPSHFPCLLTEAVSLRTLFIIQILRGFVIAVLLH